MVLCCESDYVSIWSDVEKIYEVFQNQFLPQKLRIKIAGFIEADVDQASHTVVIIPVCPEVTQQTLTHIYQDQILPSLIDHDGHLVVHGGSVVSSFGAFLFIGPSGRGKSTLVTALGLAGNRIQNDDSAIIDLTDTGVVVRPIYAGLRLLPETLAAFFPPDTSTAPVSHYGTKRRVHRPDLLTEDPAPLTAILFPTGEKTDRMQLDPLPPARVCMELIGQSMALDPSDLIRAKSRLAQAAEVARRVPGFAITVPRGLAALPSACDALLSELATHIEELEIRDAP